MCCHAGNRKRACRMSMKRIGVMCVEEAARDRDNKAAGPVAGNMAQTGRKSPTMQVTPEQAR